MQTADTLTRTLTRGLRRWGVALLLSLGAVVASADAPVAPAEPGAPSAVERLSGEGERLARFYALHDGGLVWQDEAKVASLVELLQRLDGEGLTSRDYRPELLRNEARAAFDEAAGTEARVRFDRRASQTLLTALGHLQRGKLDPEHLYPGWEMPVPPPALDLTAISRALEAGEVSEVLAMARPASEDYDALRQALTRYRHIVRLGGWPRLPVRDTALHPGDVHEDVALLRRRLAVIGELEVMVADVDYYSGIALEAPAPHHYDAPLVEAVRRFQRRHLLDDDGVIGAETRAALNVPATQRLATLRANLERARWWSGGLPVPHVRVDVAGQRLRYRRPNGRVWETRVIVGQPGRSTPVLQSSITHLTLNPTWTVPPTILREDVLPRVRRDPSYLAAHNMVVLSPQGRRLDPGRIDEWRPGAVMLRQRAGPRNPLGLLVLRFPNDHLVYLHDTPDQHLFQRLRRALSSGCIRVEGILELAGLLFQDTGTERDLRGLIASGRTRDVDLARTVPLALQYWTAWGEGSGLPSFRPDIYGRDGALLAALDRPVMR
ncbi:L,D-transpeptidase family protein [Halomonas cerina]|uniref:Murein L,D-transpeptidase YcbB/YkuD n=1 Tax=Halomonas cerina TaxID=447424 RepID=A0A839V1X7_9GAMM|nr:L,D-transpeptidase family protein [Halomonas cerina]MBB3189713.1 murein L,D-transpeptidase YcbB/YkuD [Halomonas cerina]